MQYLWEKSNGSLNIYALAVNRKKLAEYRQFQLVQNIDEEQRAYRYITNTDRYKSILSGAAITYGWLTETEKKLFAPDGYGRFEGYNNGQFLSGKILSQEKLLQLYYNGFYDKKSAKVVGIASKDGVLPTETFLVTKSLVQKVNQPSATFKLIPQDTSIANGIISLLTPQDTTIVEGIISLPHSLSTLEIMLRSGNVSSYLLREPNEYLQLFALSNQPIKTYTEAELSEMFELSGKEVISCDRVEKDTKVLEKLKNPANRIIRF